MNDERKLGTRSVWAGEERSLIEGATQVPVVHSVAYGYNDLDRWRDVSLGKADGHVYNRYTNPTVDAFEEKVRQLEGGEAASAFASGMAAIHTTLFALLAPGQHVVSIKDTYGGTSRIFLNHLPKVGVACELCDTDDHDQIEARIDEGLDLLYLESPTNPTCKVLDIARLAARARAQGATVVVDNTFATPINQLPLTLGADLVIHSATKFLGGHADALGGVLVGDAELVRTVTDYREINGSALYPEAAYMLLRGMKTLQIRIERQNASALRIATWLSRHPKVARVFYPGLESDPGHEISKRQSPGGFGGMLAFELHGDFEAVRIFAPALQLAHRAANLGAVETIIAPPRTGSHVELTADERASLGIPEGLVRYSTGIEDADDLIADLDQALAQVPDRLTEPA
ncbi:MAG: cystathionine gamma-synthase family protein [Trueperaceae bacterium]